MNTQKSAVVRIVIWSCVAVLLTVVLIGGVFMKLNFHSLFQLNGPVREICTMSRNADEFDSLNIHWHAGTVQIRPSDDNQMRLVQSARYDASPLDCEIKNGCLTIQEKAERRFIVFGFITRSSDLELWLPVKQYQEFVYQMTSGNADIQGVSAENMQLVMTSGKCKANSLKAESLNIKITSGQMNVAASSADSLAVKVTSGKAELSGTYAAIKGKTTSGRMDITTDAVPTTLETQITSGKIAVTIPDNDGFTLRYHKTSGDVKSDFNLNSLNGKEGNSTYLSGGSEKRTYSAEITSGTFELWKAD